MRLPKPQKTISYCICFPVVGTLPELDDFVAESNMSDCSPTSYSLVCVTVGNVRVSFLLEREEDRHAPEGKVLTDLVLQVTAIVVVNHFWVVAKKREDGGL